jgi:inner membrane transporter RhtA
MAMRRLNTRTFGILMSGDPAILALMGWLFLQQDPTTQKLLGIACVVLASALTTITAGPRKADS